MSDKELIAALRSTRPGFAEEGRLHKLLVDSYTGGGGFSNGRVPTPPVPFWGLGAYEDARLWQTWFADRGSKSADGEAQTPAQESPSYLNAFYGESNLEYRDRIDNSTYTNTVEPIVNVVKAFLCETDATRKNLGEVRSRWIQRVTRTGESMGVFMESVLMRCQLTGWSTILVDTPAEPTANLAESFSKNKLPFLTAYWPQQILDYDLDDDGTLVGLKVSTWHELPRNSMLDAKTLAERITIWTPTTWERWEIVDKAVQERITDKGPVGRVVFSSAPELDEEPVIRSHSGKQPHHFGRLPAVICRWAKPPNDDPIKGHPQVGTIAQIARKLYNLESERDDQLRKQTFGILVLPSATQEGRDEQKGQENIGTGNYLEEPWGCAGLTRFIAPPGTPLEAYKSTIDGKVMDSYRTSLVDPGLSRQAETAEARKIRFRQTNAMLAHVAGNLDRAETEVLKLVGFILKLSDPERDPVEVKRKDDYAITHIIGEVVSSIERTLKFPVHPTTRAALINAGCRSLLTDLADEELSKLEKLNLEWILALAAKEATTTPEPPAEPAKPEADGAGDATKAGSESAAPSDSAAQSTPEADRNSQAPQE